jgi:hypothetical protein
MVRSQKLQHRNIFYFLFGVFTSIEKWVKNYCSDDIEPKIERNSILLPNSQLTVVRPSYLNYHFYFRMEENNGRPTRRVGRELTVTPEEMVFAAHPLRMRSVRSAILHLSQAGYIADGLQSTVEH